MYIHIPDILKSPVHVYYTFESEYIMLMDISNRNYIYMDKVDNKLATWMHVLTFAHKSL